MSTRSDEFETLRDEVGKGTLSRVRLGPCPKIEELDAANGRLDQLSIKAMRLKVKKIPVNLPVPTSLHCMAPV